MTPAQLGLYLESQQRFGDLQSAAEHARKVQEGLKLRRERQIERWLRQLGG